VNANEPTVVIGNVAAIESTEKGLKVLINGTEHWVQRGQIAAESQVKQEGDSGNLVVSQWFADRSDLFAPGNPDSQPKREELSNEPGRGVLFANPKVAGKRPHFRGGFNYWGTEIRLGAWKHTSKKGVEYLALVIDEYLYRGEKGGGRETQAMDAAVHAAAAPPDDDIPL
jgi:hypothetical protein